MRGTTPTHTFKIPLDTSNIVKAMVIYAQNGVEVLRKETPDCVFEGNKVSETLTQEDTLKFSEESHVKIQLRFKTEDGKALKSVVKVVDVTECLNDEVL